MYVGIRNALGLSSKQNRMIGESVGLENAGIPSLVWQELHQADGDAAGAHNFTGPFNI